MGMFGVSDEVLERVWAENDRERRRWNALTPEQQREEIRLAKEKQRQLKKQRAARKAWFRRQGLDEG